MAHHHRVRKPHYVKDPTGLLDADTNVKNPLPEGRSTLPHERDEAPDPNSPQSGTRDLIRQAKRDIDRGLRDTDLHGVPSNVPGPGSEVAHAAGTEIPPQGVNRPKKAR